MEQIPIRALFDSKTKVITTANQKKGKYNKSQWGLTVETTKSPKARENAGDNVLIRFCFPFD